MWRAMGFDEYDTFLVEWDDKARDGGYSALRYVPKGPIVALGIVSTKHRELESEDQLVREIDEVSKHIDVEQLAVTPQCGFGTVAILQSVDEETQWRKLALVGAVADRIWSR